jgi:hypothetical protein
MGRGGEGIVNDIAIPDSFARAADTPLTQLRVRREPSARANPAHPSPPAAR